MRLDKKIYNLLFVGLLFFGTATFAQDSGDSLNTVKIIGLKLHKGSVLIHSRDLRPIEDSYPTGIELDLAWHKISQKAWESCHCYPRLGAALTYWGYDNKDVLGQGLTGLFYLEPVFNTQGRVNYSIRAGFGLSYQNSPFDSISNPDNLSYSTYWGFPLQLGGSVHFRIQSRWMLNA
ncbi:MAG: acyloxyacyl hydrolase, partial [Robiginitalea sp.]